MHSTLAPQNPALQNLALQNPAPQNPALKETDPHDIFDVALAPRADSAFTDPWHDVVSPPSAPPIHATSGIFASAAALSLDDTVRVAAIDNIKVRAERSALRKWTRGALIAFLFAFSSAVLAEGWKHYGNAARAIAVSWAPKFDLSSSAPPEKSGAAEQSASPVLLAAVTDPATAQPSTSAPGAAPAASPETAQLLQSMAQQIEQLKASVEQLRTGQEQMARDIAKNAENRTVQARPVEQNPRPRLSASALPPRPAVAPMNRPKPTYPPLQAAAVPPSPPPAAAYPPPRPPVQAMTQPQTIISPDGEPVVRPPMPLR